MRLKSYIKGIVRSVVVPPVEALSKKPKPIRYKPGNIYVHRSLASFSQHNEDLVVDILTGMKSRGFYVDVGANDPDRLSNTKRFYDRGWSGITIEPDPLLSLELRRRRPRDVVLGVGVGEQRGEMDFYRMSDSVYSCFGSDAATYNQKHFSAQIVAIEKIMVLPLREIFFEHLRQKEIDFLSIDVEGLDEVVLTSNDWSLYRPKMVMVELDRSQNSVINYLKGVGYELVYNNGLNGIFSSADTL